MKLIQLSAILILTFGTSMLALASAQSSVQRSQIWLSGGEHQIQRTEAIETHHITDFYAGRSFEGNRSGGAVLAWYGMRQCLVQERKRGKKIWTEGTERKNGGQIERAFEPRMNLLLSILLL